MSNSEGKGAVAVAKLQNKDDPDRERHIINGAYGLVLGCFDGLIGSDRRAWTEWNKLDVQAAAIEAATIFVKKLER